MPATNGRIENESFPVSVNTELRSVSARMDRTDQLFSEHTEFIKHQAGAIDRLMNHVKEVRGKRLRHQADLREQMNKSDNSSAGTASVEQSQQQPHEKRYRTAIAPGSRSNAPTGGGVQSKKRPCSICGSLLSNKYLRSGKHQETKRCKNAAVFDQACDSPCVITDVRTMDGDLLYCSEEEDDEIPGVMKFEIE